MEKYSDKHIYRKTALITGASRGIGKATALRLLEEGFRVIGTSVSGNNLTIVHPRFTAMKLDLTSEQELKEFPERLHALTPGIDLLINNAGVGNDVSLTIPQGAPFRYTFDVNVFGLVMLTEALLPVIAEGGQILMLSSAMSLPANIAPNGPAYRMSKASVNIYVKMLAQRLAERNINVNALEPGWVRTDMGGKEAPVKPEDAAGFIYHAINTRSVTGHFWSYADGVSTAL